MDCPIRSGRGMRLYASLPCPLAFDVANALRASPSITVLGGSPGPECVFGER